MNLSQASAASGSGTVTLTGNYSSGSLLQNGNDTLTLAASNGYAGGTVISNGVVVSAANNALGTGSLNPVSYTHLTGTKPTPIAPI